MPNQKFTNDMSSTEAMKIRHCHDHHTRRAIRQVGSVEDSSIARAAAQSAIRSPQKRFSRYLVTIQFQVKAVSESGTRKDTDI
jgi:hypothetical protein